MSFLIILILFVFPMGELIRIDIGNNIIIKPLDIVSGMLAVVFLLNYLFIQKKFPYSFLTKPLFLFASISLFSLLVNFSTLTEVQKTSAFLYWLRYVSYFFIFYNVLVVNNEIFKKIKQYLSAVAFFFVVLGYLQFFLYPNLRNLYYLGWDEHNYRLFSSVLDPNFAGCLLVLFLMLTIPKINFTSKKISYVNLGFSAVTTLAIFLTYSRSAMVMLFVSVGTFFLLINAKKNIIYSILIFFLFLLLLIPTYGKENTNLLRKTSIVARFQTYNNSVQIIKDHFFIGVGFNTYRYAQIEYGFRKNNSQYPDHASAGVDNSFLFVMATTGVLGLLSFLYIWYSVFKRSFNLLKTKKNYYPKIVIASLLGLFINAFFINSLFFPHVVFWTFMIIGIMEREAIQH